MRCVVMAQIMVFSLLHRSVENKKDRLYSCLYYSYVDHMVNDIKTQFYQILNEGTRLSKAPVWYSQWFLVNSYDGCPDLSACITLTVLSDVHSSPQRRRWRFGKRGGDAGELRFFQFTTGKSSLHPAPCPSFGSKTSSKRSKHPLPPDALFALSARQDPPLTSSHIPSLSGDLPQMRFKPGLCVVLYLLNRL